MVETLPQLTADELVERFTFLDDWEERYRYIIELGKALPTMPDALKTEESKVQGCVSQVWLVGTPHSADDGQARLHFEGDSDAHIVKGLVALLFTLFQDRPASLLLETDVEHLFGQIGLQEHLSPSRSNGFFSMVQRMKQMAHEAA